MKNLISFKSTLLTGIIVLSSVAIAQQGAPISDVDVLAKEKYVMIEHYPGKFKAEEIQKIEKIDTKHSMIYYRRGGANFETVVNSDRDELMLIATCEQIPQTALPNIVADHFKKSKMGVNKIKNAFVVETPTSSNFYRLDFVDKDKKTESIFYDNLGMEMKAPY